MITFPLAFNKCRNSMSLNAPFEREFISIIIIIRAIQGCG